MKKILSDYEKTSFVDWKHKIEAVVGKEIPIEVKWATIDSDLENIDKVAGFKWTDQVYFNPLLAALVSICSDATGKKAIQDGVSKIVIDGSGGSSFRSSKFEAGVLTILHRLDTNVDDMDERRDGLQSLLEKKL